MIFLCCLLACLPLDHVATLTPFPSLMVQDDHMRSPLALVVDRRAATCFPHSAAR